MAKELIHNKSVGERGTSNLRIIGLSRQEALEVVCQLAAALANESLPGIDQNNVLSIPISDKGTIMYRLVLGLEDKLFEE